MAYSAPSTRAGGEFITPAIWNQDVVNNENAAFPLGVDAWTSYAPTLTQGVSLTYTATYAKYQRIGRSILVNLKLSITSAGTAGSTVVVGLPVAAASLHGVVGVFRYLDSGTTNYAGAATGVSTTTAEFYVSSNATAFGNAPAVTAASGDILFVSLTYEAAT